MTSPDPAAPPAGLPRLLLLTDGSQLPPRRRLADVVAEGVSAGLRAVVVRERDLEDRERAELVYDLGHLLQPVDGTLIVAAPQVGRPHGLHLRRTDAVPGSRPPLLGRSCHDAAGLARAARERCDYVTLSPVAGSLSKPGYGPALGRDGVRALTRPRRTEHDDASVRGHLVGVGATARPAVYALGGVTPQNAADWVAAGADGVAVMGALMRAEDPAAVTADLLSAVTHASVVTSAPRQRGAEDVRLERTR